MLAQLATQVGQNLVAVFELDAKVSGRQDFDDAALKLDMLFTAHGRADATR